MSDHGWPRFWDLYRSGAWEPQTKQLLAEHLTPGDLFVDIGAWIGPVTLWALELGAHVIAVEPDPVALDELRRLVPPTVEIWPGAVALHSGIARLGANPKVGGEYGDSMSRLGVAGVEVQTWTLTEILAGRTPAMVKVDVEGYEIDLLPTLAPDIAERNAVLQVSCHGRLPDPTWFDAFDHIDWPSDTWGDVVAFPERNP